MPTFLSRLTEWLVRREIEIPDYVSLPNDEKDINTRRNAVDLKRTLYTWTVDPRTNMAYVKDVPASEWKLGDFIHHHYGMFKAYRFAFMGLVSLGISMVRGDELMDPEGNPMNEPFRKFMDMYRYNSLPLPSVAYRWRRDTEFARQCMNGCDPTRLFRVRCYPFPEKFPCTDETVKGLLPEGTTLESLVDQRRLYMLDLEQMNGYPTDQGHYTCAPIVLFWVNERKSLMPLAIQLYQKPSEGPIFTPLDPPGVWLFVKMHVQTARITMHGPCTHLYNAHLIFEVFYIALQRHLDIHHPIFVMLKPHFWHHIAINSTARKTLLTEHSGVLVNLVGYEGFLFSMRHCNTHVTLNDIQIHSDLAKRGLEGTQDVLPDYHWRDDSLYYWNVLENYVASVVQVVYPTDDLIASDQELQGWVMELRTPKPFGCGFAEGLHCDADGRIRSRRDLIHLLTLTIFGVTAYHDGVNDGHGDIVSYIPNQPMWLGQPPPSTKTDKITEDDILKALPDMDGIVHTLALVKSLTNLGDARWAKMIALTNPFPPTATELSRCHLRFKQELAAMSEHIQRRNLSVDFGYTSMDPVVMRSSIFQ